MTISTGRGSDFVVVTIDYEKCDLCGLCAKACTGNRLARVNDRISVDPDRDTGCIGCGHCAAVCPRECITVTGRDLHPDDFITLPPRTASSSFDALYTLMLTRRSCREFRDQEVAPELVDRIIRAVSTAPMGISPSGVEILVLRGRDSVREFSDDFLACLSRIEWVFSPFLLRLLRPVLGRDTSNRLNAFVVPLVRILKDKRKAGLDWLLYGAPLAMYFHASPHADPSDATVAATYALLAAESIGLGCCMIGSVAPILKYSGKDLKKKFGIPARNQQGLMLVFGYPDVRYHRAIARRLAGVRYY